MQAMRHNFADDTRKIERRSHVVFDRPLQGFRRDDVNVEGAAGHCRRRAWPLIDERQLTEKVAGAEYSRSSTCGRMRCFGATTRDTSDFTVARTID